MATNINLNINFLLRNILTLRHKVKIYMAKLFINKEICAEADKEMLWWFTGAEGVSFPDIKSFIASIPEDDDKIEIEFHSCGGDCSEGWAMYDELRASGKEIHATNVGTCASMATVLFLAAKKENRTAREHSQFLIHNAYIPYYEGAMTIEKSQQIANDLLNERNKLLDVYVERTGCDRDTLAAQMDTDDFFGAEKAVELGFCDHIEAPLSASAAKKDYEISTSKTNKNMNDNKSMMAKVIDAIKVAFGAAEEEVVAPVALTLTTTDGTELSIEREEGDPQVGDAASPDGTHTLEDGRKIVVEEGKIVEIQQAEPSEEDKAKAELEEALNAAKEAQAQLEAKVAELEAEKAEMTAKVTDLEAQAKTEADAEILAMVAQAGGKAWLDKAASSHYEAPKRNSPKSAKVEEEENGEEADTMVARIARTRKIKK